ncbi:MAG TPA: hypothetical protein VGP76_17830 [Planctomycetaceae bacterium]|jgi:hypothetical protein|nr:hypothetical protein [Planctomycetaceae bacterium]
MTYADLRAANAQAYCRQNAAFFGLVPTWGPLWSCAGQMGAESNPQSLFNRIHDAAIQAIAAQQTQVDWSQTYAAVKPLLAGVGPSGRSRNDEAQPLITAIQSARWELATSAAEYDESLTLTKELLARHIRDAFARAGLQHLTRIRSAHTALDEPHAQAIDPSTLLATIITAVLGVVCPPTAAFSAVLEPIIAAIIKVLFSSLTTQFASGTYGASPEAFNAQLQQWAKEAAAQ